MSNELTKIIETPNQISSLLLTALQNNPYHIPSYRQNLKSKLDNILEYDKAVQFILELGNIEHTGDWDPYYIITTEKRKFETQSGANQITNHTDTTISFLDYDSDGNETEKTFQLSEIISIQIINQ
jgi:hypothetical protein